MVLHVCLWGLILGVHLHFLHLLCERCLFFVLEYLLLHVDLGAAEFLEHILVVENGVRELVLERGSFQEILDTGRNLGHPQDLMDGWAHCRVFLKQFFY